MSNMNKKDMKEARILFVEDDETLAFVVSDNLLLKGFSVTHHSNGRAALEAFMSESFDICLLDIMLKGMDGFRLAEEIRMINKQVPVIFLTARSMQEDRIRGLSIGGDDYITKPFSMEELLLRMNVFLKRRNIAPVEGDDVCMPRAGNYTLDHANLVLLNDGSGQALTMTEADLIRLFFSNPNKVIKREDILTAVWGDDSLYLSRSLDVFISRLRKLLSGDSKIEIKNVRSIGFVMKYSA